MRRRANDRERRIGALLRERDIAYESQTHVSFACLDGAKKRAFADFTIYSTACIVVLEVDQYQHEGEGYTVLCDCKRMVDVRSAMLAAGNTQPLLWVRYNPDRFSIDGQRVRVPKARREQQLMALIQRALSGEMPQQDFGIAYMYYNTDAEGQPLILQDERYPPELAKSCLISVAD